MGQFRSLVGEKQQEKGAQETKVLAYLVTCPCAHREPGEGKCWQAGGARQGRTVLDLTDVCCCPKHPLSPLPTPLGIRISSASL